MFKIPAVILRVNGETRTVLPFMGIDHENDNIGP